MKTYIAYTDESGDPGNTLESSNFFIMTGVYMPVDSVYNNHLIISEFRKDLELTCRLPADEEMHTQHFMLGKKFFRKLAFTKEEKIKILKTFIQKMTELDLNVINVIIHKQHRSSFAKDILGDAVTYLLQRLEMAAKYEKWNYFFVSDNGRVDIMRKKANALRKENYIPSHYPGESHYNAPITHLLDGMYAANSKDSPFIQIADFIAYFVNLYMKVYRNDEPLPKQIQPLFPVDFLEKVFRYWESNSVLNLKASKYGPFGFVIY